jgi:hypothetical protein
MARFLNWLCGSCLATLLVFNTSAIFPGMSAGFFNHVSSVVSGDTWHVATAFELQIALMLAHPGQTIELAAGIYRGAFVISQSGTTEKPITLRGNGNAIIDSGTIALNYALLIKADHWRIEDLTVRNAKKGIVLEAASHNVLSRVRVMDIGEEGVRMRGFSIGNTLRDSTILRTGRLRAGYGEGVYIGTSNDKWHFDYNGEPDRSDFNQVINCNIGPEVTAEHIDIKEGTTGGIIRNNVMNGAGISGENYADSFLDVKGNAYVIEDNVGFVNGPSSILDGIQIHDKLGVWGKRNVFRNNSISLSTRGYGINVKPGNELLDPNRVEDNNEIVGAAKGSTNVNPKRAP